LFFQHNIADSNELSRQQFIQEIMVMKDLERHPNILQLVGCITLSGPVYLVMDYAANGDLLSFLHQQRAKSVSHIQGKYLYRESH